MHWVFISGKCVVSKPTYISGAPGFLMDCLLTGVEFLMGLATGVFFFDCSVEYASCNFLPSTRSHSSTCSRCCIGHSLYFVLKLIFFYMDYYALHFIECPSVSESIASSHFEWSEPPELRLCRKQTEENG